MRHEGSENDRTTDNLPAGKPLIPADRDEQAAPPKEDGQHRLNREPIRQAHEDVEAGIEDTERIGVPTTLPTSTDGAEKP